MNKNADSELTREVKNKVVMLWVLTLFFGVIAGFLFHRFGSKDPYIQEQSKEALNWSITTLIGLMLAIILSFVLGTFLIPIVGVVHFIFCLKGAVASGMDERFHVPFAIRLVK